MIVRSILDREATTWNEWHLLPSVLTLICPKAESSTCQPSRAVPCSNEAILANPPNEEVLAGINADDGRVCFTRLTGTAFQRDLSSIIPDGTGATPLATTTGYNSPSLVLKELKMTNSNISPMRYLRRAAVFVTLVFGTAACFHVIEPPATTDTAKIGPMGGTLTATDGTQVVIPAGALDADTTISVKLSSAGSPALPEDLTPGPIYEFTPHDIVFNKPVILRVPVPAGVDDTVVLMASPGGEWQAHEATVTDGYAEWQRNSFSWGIVALECRTLQ